MRPGLSTIWLRSTTTVPAPELLIAAPPPPEALPLSVESTISRRPARGGTVGWTSHGYSLGSSWFTAPPTFEERLSLTTTLSRRVVPLFQFWMPAPASSV